MVISRSDYIVEDRLESIGLVRGGDPRITAFNEFAEVIANPTERLVGFEPLTDEANVTADSQTWVIIHGYNSSSDGPNINTAEQSVVQHARPNDRILSLDWREAAANQISPIGNFVAATWSAPVAEYVAQTLQNQYGISPQSASNTVNLVGHSLGAYMAGEIGKAFRDGVTDEAGNPVVSGNGVGVRTITALDPASRANNLLAQDNFI